MMALVRYTKVGFKKNRSKLISVLLLCLLRIFMKQTLGANTINLFTDIHKKAGN